MLQGKALILATKPYAVEDRAKSWRLTLSTLLLLCIAFAGAVLDLHIAVRVVSSLFICLLLVRIFCIYHDYLHHTILEGSVAARVIFTIVGNLMLNPPNIWKRSHDYHHQNNSKLHTSSIGSFPVTTKSKFLSSSKQEQNRYLFIRHPLTILAGYLFAFVWGMCLLSIVRNPKKHWDSSLAIIAHGLFGFSIYYIWGTTAFWLAFALPSLFYGAVGAYLFYAQHNFPSTSFEPSEDWTYIGAALESSSYMKMNKVLAWFSANIGYHHIHHTNARIPFYKLPEVFKAFPEFQKAKETSLKPSDIWACLKLKAWDDEARKMITLKELNQ